MPIVGIDHVQLVMPRDGEDRARAFYSGLLGIPEVPKPAALARRGGVRFEQEDARVHLGVDPRFRAAHRAHPAFLVLDLGALVQQLRTAGVEVIDDDLLSGYERASVTIHSETESN